MGMTICFDTETTGLNRDRKDNIIQLSMMDVDTGIEILNTYYMPSNPILVQDNWREYWGYAADVNNITLEELRGMGYPTIQDEEEHQYVQSIIDQTDVFMGYNVWFDANMLLQEGFDIEGKYWIDVMYAFADYYGHLHPYDQKTNGKDLWLGWADGGIGKWNPLKLVEAAEYFGIGFGEEGAHNSMADVRATVDVWNAIQEMQMFYEQRGFATDPVSGEYLSDPDGNAYYIETDPVFVSQYGNLCQNVHTQRAMSFDACNYTYTLDQLAEKSAWRK